MGGLGREEGLLETDSPLSGDRLGFSSFCQELPRGGCCFSYQKRLALAGHLTLMLGTRDFSSSLADWAGVFETALHTAGVA